jgi:hypothetical protein
LVTQQQHQRNSCALMPATGRRHLKAFGGGPIVSLRTFSSGSAVESAPSYRADLSVLG